MALSRPNAPAAQPALSGGWENLTPQEIDRLKALGFMVNADGSIIGPDGTPFAPLPPPPADASVGDYGGLMAGAPARIPAGMAPPPAPDLAMMPPGTRPRLRGPLYDRYNATAQAPFPGTPGGVGGGPLPDAGLPNPMGEAMPAPFAAPAVTPPLQAPPNARPPEGSVTQPEPAKPAGSPRDRLRARLGRSTRPMGGRRRR